MLHTGGAFGYSLPNRSLKDFIQESKLDMKTKTQLSWVIINSMLDMKTKTQLSGLGHSKLILRML